jgi:hypothetical protein
MEHHTTMTRFIPTPVPPFIPTLVPPGQSWLAPNTSDSAARHQQASVNSFSGNHGSGQITLNQSFFLVIDNAREYAAMVRVKLL